MSSAQQATDATFDELVLKNDKPVIVDFWAEWCGTLPHGWSRD